MKDNQIFSEIFLEQVNSIKLDFYVYWSKKGDVNIIQAILYMVTCHGWHVMFNFRLGKIIYAIRIPIVSHILKMIFQIFWFVLTTFYGIWIDLTCKIGSGFYIGHYGGIIIHGDFGDNCSVGQGVTIGSKGAGKSDGWPRLGDDVYIGAGAKVIGCLVVGDSVIIGANSVVVRDVPSNSLVVGIPGVIKNKKS